jgi:hypothetical protein
MDAALDYQETREYHTPEAEGPDRLVVKLILEACKVLLTRGGLKDRRVEFKLPRTPMDLFTHIVHRESTWQCLEALTRVGEAGASVVFHKWRPEWTAPSETHAQTIVQCTAPQKGTFTKSANEWAYKLWDKRWASIKECGQTRFWFPKSSKEMAKELLRLRRCDLGLMIQFVTGHGWFNRHALIVGEAATAACRLCGEEDGATYTTSETPIHLATTCPEMNLVSPFHVNNMPSLSQTPQTLVSTLISPQTLLVFVQFVVGLAAGTNTSRTLTRGFRGRSNFLDTPDSEAVDVRDPTLGPSHPADQGVGIG